MSVPSWVQDAVFYQIFPDRFYNGDLTLDSANNQPWDSPPTVRGFKGGDLKGIIQKFDYLLDLGVNAIYLNPIFSSTANHRYHTNDYFKIDRTLGTLEDFKNLLSVAHQNNMHVIIDGVFNHSGRGFFAFTDVLDNGGESRYKDWYFINGFPLDAFGDGKATRYKAWWDIKDLPKLNTNNHEVRAYLMKVAGYWIEQGVDGWRLDVPAEIDDDSFWAEFRRVVKMANPNAYTVGEIWDGNPRWVGDAHFDGLMHYPLRDAITDLLEGKMNAKAFADRMESFLTMYDRENVYAMYLPLGSHDTRRLVNKMNGDLNKVRLAFMLQFANPGAPAIYYGDEIGLPGEKDPDNRRAFPWHNEGQWNHDLRKYVQKLIAVRKQHAALRRGDLVRVYVSEDEKAYAFARRLGEDQVLVVINPTGEARTVTVPMDALGWQSGTVVQDLISGTRQNVSENGLTFELAPWGSAMTGTFVEY